jgi:hypothetical protein
MWVRRRAKNVIWASTGTRKASVLFVCRASTKTARVKHNAKHVKSIRTCPKVVNPPKPIATIAILKNQPVPQRETLNNPLAYAAGLKTTKTTRVSAYLALSEPIVPRKMG